MSATCTRLAASLALTLIPLLTPAFAHAQASQSQTTRSPSRVHVAAGAGVLTSGAYFTGPQDLELASGDAAAGMLQASLGVHRSLTVVLGGAYARPEWRLTGVPLIGTVGVQGASLWFADAALRGQVPLGPAPAAPSVFAQAGAGLARYSVVTSMLGVAVDEQATNFAVGLGAGITIPLTGRLGVEVMAKDYIASFRSVQDLAEFGVEGELAHTVLLLASATLGL